MQTRHTQTQADTLIFMHKKNPHMKGGLREKKLKQLLELNLFIYRQQCLLMGSALTAAGTDLLSVLVLHK